MNKIIYIANIRLPTEKAHGIQIMKTCEAFVAVGSSLELWIPKRKNIILTDPFEYYRVKKIFLIRKFICLDFVQSGKVGFWIESFTFALSVLKEIISLPQTGVVYYSRDELIVFFLILIRRKVVWESHMGHLNFIIRFLIKRNIQIVTISKGLENFYRSLGATWVITVPDAVDIEQFKIFQDKNEIRTQLGLPLEKKIILYTGHLYEWKGAHLLVEASRKLNDDHQVVFVGGTDTDINNFNKKYSSVKNLGIIGRKPHYEIPLYLKAVDILVIPNSAKEDISRLYTSPMKLFEYMASGTPIVTADLPSLREILNEENACFFEADDADSLVKTIDSLLNNREKQTRISNQASRDILKYSWDCRAKQIISFMYD